MASVNSRCAWSELTNIKPYSYFRSLAAYQLRIALRMENPLVGAAHGCVAGSSSALTSASEVKNMSRISAW
jgi:hypothetical protein